MIPEIDVEEIDRISSNVAESPMIHWPTIAIEFTRR